jgi:hypothetical protein
MQNCGTKRVAATNQLSGKLQYQLASSILALKVFSTASAAEFILKQTEPEVGSSVS